MSLGAPGLYWHVCFGDGKSKVASEYGRAFNRIAFEQAMASEATDVKVWNTLNVHHAQKYLELTRLQEAAFRSGVPARRVQPPTKRTKKKRRKQGPNDTTTFIPSEAGFIPPALLFVVAPIMFVCFIAYGVATPNNYNAGLVSSSHAHMTVKHDTSAHQNRKMFASARTEAKSLESNFNVYSNEKKTVRHLRHAVNAVKFVHDVKKKSSTTRVNKNVHKKIKKGKHTSKNHKDAGNHGGKEKAATKSTKCSGAEELF